MTHTMKVFIGDEITTLDLNMGIKIGHSLYIVSEYDNPLNKSQIIDMFFSSTLETAIRKAVEYDEFEKLGYICLITGDGQVCKITKQNNEVA